MIIDSVIATSQMKAGQEGKMMMASITDFTRNEGVILLANERHRVRVYVPHLVTGSGLLSNG